MKKAIAIIMMKNAKTDFYCYWHIFEAKDDNSLNMKITEWLDQRTDDLENDEIILNTQVDEIK